MTSHPQETIAQRLHRKGIKPRRDIILSDADLSNGINIEINGVLLPVDWDKHESLLEDRWGFSYPLALNLDNYDWVPFVDSESELQALMDALSAAAPYDELAASLIIPKDFDSPIRVFRRFSYDTVLDYSLYASDFDPDSSYEIFSLDLTPNSASIFLLYDS